MSGERDTVRVAVRAFGTLYGLWWIAAAAWFAFAMLIDRQVSADQLLHVATYGVLGVLVLVVAFRSIDRAVARACAEDGADTGRCWVAGGIAAFGLFHACDALADLIPPLLEPTPISTLYIGFRTPPSELWIAAGHAALGAMLLAFGGEIARFWAALQRRTLSPPT